VNGAAGTRQRIIERHRYMHRPKAHRAIRVISDKGATQTYKKKGDLIIVNPHVKSMKVTQNGWY
jgi:hypothetical protein